MRRLREEFFNDDNNTRQSDLKDEFAVMKQRLMEDFFAERSGRLGSEANDGNCRGDFIAFTI